MLYQITDLDDAYDNGAHIPHADTYVPRWTEAAAAFRAAHPPQDLGRGHLFLPEGDPRGLMVFIHGGYWMRFDPTLWSHLAGGALAAGWACAMPGYPLAPDARIADMTRIVAEQIAEAAGRIAGPIALTGHSAGGHLVTRMISDTSPLPADIRARVRNTVSISGVHDLRPLLGTRLNEALRLTPDEAERESPALLRPAGNVRLCCWVGATERADFIRQNDLLANIWTGLGAATSCYHEPDRHHFNVVDGLADPDHPLTRTLLS